MNPRADILGRGRWRAAFSYIELLASLAIALLIVAGGISVLIQVMRDYEISQRRLEAVVHARGALRDMSFEIKKAAFYPAGAPYFSGVNVHTISGNRLDDDDDGATDEDDPDGREGPLEDNVFTDQHVTIGTKTERAAFVGVADLGDPGVDSDPVFDLDTLAYYAEPDASLVGKMQFVPQPGQGGPVTTGIVRIEYRIGSFDGESNVLLRDMALVDTASGTTVTTATEPLAYNVLGLNLLYWDANLATPYWMSFWDTSALPFPGPGIELPSSVYIEITVYSGLRPLDSLGPTDPLETISLATMANIEAALADPRYATMVRPPS
jgi:hypothetical protein